MEFSPNNPIVRLCLQGMAHESKGEAEEASKVFLQAWNESTHDFEKFISAYYVSRHQNSVAGKLQWLQTDLQLALTLRDDAVNAAFPILYSSIGKCYEELGDTNSANLNYELANSFPTKPTDQGPFYHGTKANLQAGKFLNPGGQSNYQADLMMNHIYFTALINGAGLAASLAKGDGSDHVYMVEPTGDFENDPNVTNQKFPGNPTRSSRSTAPLKIIGEVKDWMRTTPEELKQWKQRLENNKGEIIN